MRRGYLMILCNVREEDEREFNLWYDREHIGERVDIPGFVSAQRFVAVEAARCRYLSTYETETLRVFHSPAYRRALDDQSSWSRSILPKFVDPQRSVGETTLRAGRGTGRLLYLHRLLPAASGEERLRRHLAEDLFPRLRQQDGVVRVDLLEADATLSRPVAEYPKGGLSLFAPQDWYILIGSTAEVQVGMDLEPEIPASLLDTLEFLGEFGLLWDLHGQDGGEGTGPEADGRVSDTQDPAR